MIKRIKRKIRNMTGPEVLRELKVVGERLPRKSIGKKRSIITIQGDDSAAIFHQMDALSEDIYQELSPEDRVLIKINLNTGLQFPASTDLEMLERVVYQLNHRGIRQITIGDCSSNSSLPTRAVMKEKRLIESLKDRAKFSCFDEENWVRVKMDFQYLKDLVVPESVYDADKIIYLANVKTHRHADFSMGMKLAIGFMHPLQRIDLHASQLKEKVVEMCLAIQPDLIILDGRRPFIDGGPNKGVAVDGDRVIIGSSLLETDLVGYDYLYKLKKTHNLIGTFKDNPFEMRQFAVAKEICNSKVDSREALV